MTVLPFILSLILAAPSLAQAPMSRGDHMKACAAQWREQKHLTKGVRYQRFLSDCMKTLNRPIGLTKP